MTGHVPKIAGHDAETTGHALPNYALGFGASDLASIERTFREITAIGADDGIVFDAATINVQEIRKDAGDAGARVIFVAESARARCKV